MNPILIDSISSLAIARKSRKVDEVLGFPTDFLSEARAIIGCQTVAEDLHFVPIVNPGNGLHQMGSGMVAEIRRDVTDSEATIKLGRELVRWFVKHTDLFQTQLGVSIGNTFAELMREWVQHRMMRVNRRQTVLFQLIANNRNQALLTTGVIGPIAHNLI